MYSLIFIISFLMVFVFVFVLSMIEIRELTNKQWLFLILFGGPYMWLIAIIGLIGLLFVIVFRFIRLPQVWDWFWNDVLGDGKDARKF